VIAGAAKGTRLAPVPSGTRPVSDRAREGLFSSLGEAVVGARVLDLFAGTGALGIEALSRGATSAVFVDSAPAAVRTVGLNLAHTRLGGSAQVRKQEVRRALRSNLGQFDLVVVDPPYAMAAPELDHVLAAIEESGRVVPGGRIVLTRSTRSYMPVIPVNWLVERRLSYGDTLVLVFQIP
jgi:16S rRNA (guanine966-N2)-methyltransferase